MFQAPPRLKSNYDLLPGIIGNQIKCSTTKHQNAKTQDFATIIKQPQETITSPKKSVKQQYFMDGLKNKKSNAIIDCKTFSKLKTEENLSTFDQQQQLPSYRSPKRFTKPFSSSFLTPNQTNYSFNHSPSLRSIKTSNVDQILEELKQEFMTDNESKQKVIDQLKEKIRKDNDIQREIKQNKLSELDELKEEYLKFCQSITKNNMTQVDIQQKNMDYLNKIMNLEKNINEIKNNIRTSENRLIHLDSLSVPKQSNHLIEMKKLFAELDDAVNDFCYKYEQEHPDEDIQEIFGYL